MTSSGTPTPPRRRVVEAWAALVVLVAGLALVALVSRSGDTRDISSRDRPYRPPPPPETEPAQSGGPAQPPTPTSNEGGSAPGWFADLMRVLAIVAAVIFVLLIIRYLIKTFRVLDFSKLRGGTKVDEDELEFAPGEVTQALADAVDETLLRIERGEPRDAIVACWVRLEDVAAQAGIERRPSETSAELTERVLGTHWVTDERLDNLSRLYREARYSSHSMSEEARQRARVALEEIRAELAEHVRLARETAAAADAADAEARNGGEPR